MRVRALDSTGDWTFGASLNNYKQGNAAVSQMIQTRLSSFVGNCFFDTTAGIDWFTYLGGKNALALNLTIAAVIMNTKDPLSGVSVILGINQLSISLTPNRAFSVSYQVQSVYSLTGGSFSYDLFGSA